MYSFCQLTSDTPSYLVYDTIEAIIDTWDFLLPEEHHLKSAQLLIIENTKPEHINFKYIIIEENAKPIGVAYLQLLNFNANHYNNDLLNSPKLERIKSHILKKNTNLLICGNLFRSNFQSFYFNNKEDNPLILKILKSYAKTNQNKINFSGILLKDCIEEFEQKELKKYCYKPFLNDITMFISIKNSWKTFEDYLGQLSKKYLQRAKKIRQAKKEIVTTPMNLVSIIENNQKIEALYLQVSARQPIKMGILNAQYFIEMKKTLGESFQLIGYYLENQLIAFSSYIIDSKSIEIHYVGFDTQYNEQYKLYFNIIFDGIEMAIQTNKNDLALGRTALDAKASAGALPIYNNNYICLKLGLPSIVYNFFNKQFRKNQNEDWKKRLPFKESPISIPQ